MNNVVLIGRLTKDPELSHIKDDTAMCKFTLAVDRQGKDGADFIRIVTWNKTAENCSKYLAKGRQAAVQGRIQTGSYKNKDGHTVYTTDVIANNVQFLGSNGSDERTEVPDEEIKDLPYEALKEDIPF